jgi:hypothetical protein
MRRLLGSNRIGRAGKYDGIELLGVLWWIVKGMDFTVDEKFSNTSGDQLGVL